ncbi:MAG: SDR family NAD(P)-dependent oxidoreductase [Proteobacteria bacterium]|nr:SDR family NAD(P)-dependent oxidoreductase [Pseudomonadota bacterium]
MKPSDFYPGKKVFITGGASGIGRALALEMAGHGASVVLADVNAPLLEETAAEIASATGRRVFSIPLDVTDYEAFREAVDRAEESLGFLDVFVNNAGIGVAGELTAIDPADIRRITGVNWLGVVYGCRIACERFAARGCGHVVNVASVAGLQGFPKMSLYCGTKAGVVGFSQALRFEMERKGVKVSLALPSTTDTPMILDELASGKADAPGILLAIPMCRACDVAVAVAEGVAQGRFYIFPTMTDRMTLTMRSWLPGAFNAFIRAVGFREFSGRKKKIREKYNLAGPGPGGEA